MQTGQSQLHKRVNHNHGHKNGKPALLTQTSQSQPRKTSSPYTNESITITQTSQSQLHKRVNHNHTNESITTTENQLSSFNSSLRAKRLLVISCSNAITQSLCGLDIGNLNIIESVKLLFSLNGIRTKALTVTTPMLYRRAIPLSRLVFPRCTAGNVLPTVF